MVTAMMDQAADEIKDQVISWRRHLHEHPELSFCEEQTSQFVYDTVQSFGNLEVTRPTETSVVARLVGTQPGKVLAIRADMDALPIHEASGLEFASKNLGVMHACGHDGHTAMLLGAAKILSGMKEQIKGEVRFIFQHAEEKLPGGAQQLVDAGVMEGVDLIICAHLKSLLEVGKVGIVYGRVHASPDVFSITIRGKGGHAAKPHEVIDSIATAAQVVVNLQHIVSRTIDPLDSLVISITKFVSGTNSNVIPDEVNIAGTARSFDPALRDKVPGLMEQVISGITYAHGANYEFHYEHGYRPVINDADVTGMVEQTVIEQFGAEAVTNLRPGMGGEDFSAYLQKAPGCFFYVGAGNKAKGFVHPHHHPRFAIDERSLHIGMKTFLFATAKIVM